MLTKGLLVVIVNFHEYTGCIGTFKAQEEKLALITMVYCSKGEKYEYLAGIPVSAVKEYSAIQVPSSQKVRHEEKPQKVVHQK